MLFDPATVVYATQESPSPQKSPKHTIMLHEWGGADCCMVAEDHNRRLEVYGCN